MGFRALRSVREEIAPWKKGEEVKSQSIVYTRLPTGHIVKFYQEGMEGTDGFKIEIAMDAIPQDEYFLRSDEILQEVDANAKGRKICTFNL